MNGTILSAVADHLWQSTVFAAVAWLLTLALRKNRARVRHGLWLAASLKFLVPFSLLIALGGQVQWRKAPPPQQRGIAMTADRVSEPFAGAVAEIVLPSVLPGKPNPLPAILFGVWTFGFVGVGATWLIRWRRIRAAVHASSPVELDIPIRVVSSQARLEPGVFGVFRPVLLLPEGIGERLTPEQLAAVIEHELCHVRHRDNLTAAVHMLVEVLFWFHPLVWWIEKRMVEERERACDEEVVRRVADSRAYAEGILNVCKLYVESPLACVPGVGGANLRNRIEAILSKKRSLHLSTAKKAALAAAGVTAIAVPIVIGVMNAPVRAQSARAATPKWEVVAIRRCEDGPNVRGGGGPGEESPGRLNLNCAAVKVLIQLAYGTFANGRADLRGYDPQDQRFVPYLPIEGGPAWINSARYQINAKAESDASRQMMEGPMMQALLEDRFKLKIRRKTREIPVYALTVAKGGPKLRPHAEGSCTVYDPNNLPLRPPNGSTTDCGMGWLRIKGPNLTFDPRGVTMAAFAQQLQLDRPVVDRTGIKGLFDIHLEFALDDTTRGTLPHADEPGAVLPDPAGGTPIFTAVQEQLGLKLERAKGPQDFLVIDSVERPSEN